jgi:hypothetical protein
LDGLGGIVVIIGVYFGICLKVRRSERFRPAPWIQTGAFPNKVTGPRARSFGHANDGRTTAESVLLFAVIRPSSFQIHVLNTATGDVYSS